MVDRLELPPASPVSDADLREGLTARGTRLLAYSQLEELGHVASARNLVLQSIEGWECDRDSQRLRMDATASYPHDEYGDDWGAAVSSARAFIFQVVLASVPDREQLLFQAWLDDGN